MGLATAVSVVALGATVTVAFRALGWRGTPRLGASLLVGGAALWTEPVQRALFLGQAETPLAVRACWVTWRTPRKLQTLRGSLPLPAKRGAY
jgi:hypothetical protein